VHPTDEATLKQIFEAASIEPAFELRKTDAEVLIGELARSQRVITRVTRCRSESGYFTQIVAASRIVAGALLKYRKGCLSP
jgi:hypothetical protein